MHPNTFCKYRKKYSHRLACILLKVIRETSQTDLDRSAQSIIFQFSSYFKYSLINNYTIVCYITQSSDCYVCG